MSNRFAPLSQMVDGDDDIINTEATAVPKKTYIPPVTIVNQSYKEILDLLKVTKISEFKIKPTSIGTKVFCATKENYEQLNTALLYKNYSFFSHDPDKNPFKFVLYGLPNFDTEILSAELVAKGITSCSDIKKMNIKNMRYMDHATYILYFPRGTIKLQTLRNIKSLFSVLVRWDYYRASNKGPIRCFNCQTFGHGAKWCHPYVVYVPVITRLQTAKKRKKIKDPALSASVITKCANCKGNHTSYDRSCPKRNEFINLQQILREKSNKGRKKTGDMSANFNIAHHNFPQLRRTTGSNNQFSNSAPNTLSNVNPWVHKSNVNSESNSNLFSPNEIISLTNEIISSLRVCKNKDEQFLVITKLSFKYLYNYEYKP